MQKNNLKFKKHLKTELYKSLLHQLFVLNIKKTKLSLIYLSFFVFFSLFTCISCNLSPKIIPFSFTPDKIKEGQKSFASCVSSHGDKPLKFKWLKDGQEIKEKLNLISIISDNDISLLKFLVTSFKDQGNYTCELSNNYGIDKYTTELIVLALPRWSFFSEDQSIEIGQKIILKCLAEGNPQPSITWFFSKNYDRNFQILDKTDNLDFGNDSSILIIQRSQKENEGVYRCEASNQLSQSITREINVKVEVPPKLTYAQPNTTVTTDSSVDLKCEAKDSPKTNIVWNKIWPENSKSVFFGSQYYADGSQKIAQTKKYLGSGTIFTLTNIQAKDAGFYECVAESSITKLISNQIFYVEVKLPVKVSEKETYVTIKRDETAILKCEVHGTSPIQVNWLRQQRNGLFVPVFNNETYSQFTNSDYSSFLNHKHDNYHNYFDNRILAMSKDFANTNRVVFELHISLAKQKDSGFYICVASNNFGEDKSKIHLLVQDVPEAPERLEIDQVWSRSASLKWVPVRNLPNESPVQSYLLQYWRDIKNDQPSLIDQNSNKTTTEPKKEIDQQAETNYGSVYRLYELEIPANQNQFLLQKNLLPGANYRLRLYSVNSFGKSYFSANARLTTEQEEPGLPPTDIRIHSKSTSSIKLSWRAPPRNSWNGALSGYLVAYKIWKETEDPSTINSQTINLIEQTFAFNTVKFTGQSIDDYYQEYLLTNLQKETFYCIMIRALNRVGNGPYSQPLIIPTSNNDPPEAPVAYIEKVNKNSIVIKWTQNKNKEDLTHYVLYYKDDKTVWLEKTFPAKDKNSYTLTDLNEGTMYEIYMKANSHYGLSEPSKIIRQTTLSTVKDFSGGSLRMFQDSASRMFGSYSNNIPPYLRSYVVIPISTALVLIVIICAVAIGYVKYEEKKTALIQASLGMMVSSPSKNFHYLNTASSPTVNLPPNLQFNTSNSCASNMTFNSSTVSEEGYHSIKYNDFDKSNKPLLAAKPVKNANHNLWAQNQGPIMEETENFSLLDDSFPHPYATLPSNKDDENNKVIRDLPPPLPSGRPNSMNLLKSAINITNQLEKNNLYDLNKTNLSNTSHGSASLSSFQPHANSTMTSSMGQDSKERKYLFTQTADVHRSGDDSSDSYDFFKPHNF